MNSPARVVVRSLAKINIGLRVLHKRNDGFHELRTIFQTVSLADKLDVELNWARPSRITVDSAIDIPDNIIVKATDRLLSVLKISAQVHFRLRKRIPLGGGLGGGSSNAAAVLLALPALAGKPISLESLLELGSELGSDVPFFLLGGTAMGIGRGTELYPLPDVRIRHAILVCPGLHVSTADAYRGLQREGPQGLTGEAGFRTMGTFQSFAWRVGDFGTGKHWDAINDFETVVFNQYPQLKSIKGKLSKMGARPAMMSGSGSTIFGIFDDRRQRDSALESLKKEFLSSGVSRAEIHAVSLISRAQYRALWHRQLGTESETWPPRNRFAK